MLELYALEHRKRNLSKETVNKTLYKTENCWTLKLFILFTHTIHSHTLGQFRVSNHPKYAYF